MAKQKGYCILNIMGEPYIAFPRDEQIREYYEKKELEITGKKPEIIKCIIEYSN